ncbi:MAG TPA: hypothetical protein VII91_10330 [Bauldia sp.]
MQQGNLANDARGCQVRVEAAVHLRSPSMRPEIRRPLFAVAVFVAVAASVTEATPKPPAGDRAQRYVLSAAPGGFVRLDTTSGAVSHCNQQAGVWYCDALAGEDAGLKARLDALAVEVAKLTTTVAALDGRVSRLETGEPKLVPTAAPASTAKRPGFAGQAVHRLVVMIRALKHRPASAG